MERLAERMRPANLSEWIGQAHILAEGKPLRMAIEQDRVPSMIFYGPPGCGKTSLAFLIGKLTKAHVIKMHASDATVKDVRAAIEQAQSFGRMHNQQTILFLDEIHRFTATQQDALLSAVEKGTIILIGATTEHPGFSIQKALLSRVTLFVFHPLSEVEIEGALLQALQDERRGIGLERLTCESNVLRKIAENLIRK